MRWVVSCNRTLWCAMLNVLAAASLTASTAAAEIVTNLHQFQGLVARDQWVTVDARLEGVICWVSPREDHVVLQDASGAALMEVDPKRPALRTGDLVRVEGSCTGTGGGQAFAIGSTLLVSNERFLPGQTGAGQVFLTKGSHPIRVSWFNRDGSNQLSLAYEGPGFSLRQLPDSVLVHGAPDRASPQALLPGVHWRSYEGSWWQIPDFNKLKCSGEGTASNFDVSLRTRDKFVGLCFEGRLEVSEAGNYKFLTVSSGGCRLFVGLPTITVVGRTNPPAPRSTVLAQILPSSPEGGWSSARGEVEFFARQPPGGWTLILKSGTGKIRVEVADDSARSLDLASWKRVEVTGICWSSSTLDGQRIPGVLWVPDARLVKPVDLDGQGAILHPESASGNDSRLNTIAEIKQLKREQAMLGKPVRIRGVVTWADRSAVILQDSTSGIFVDELDVHDDSHLRIGEYWEVEGLTVAQFSPMVHARSVKRLGRGIFPEPIQPAWDQLMNGSLDALYVELRGIVTAVDSNRVTLLTQDGKLQTHLTDTPPEDISRHAGALVRIRGCLWAAKDEVTHMFRIGEVQMHSALIQVDEPPPVDPFQAPLKRAAELRLFDAQAAVLKQVKVVGQVIHSRAGRHYLMDGTNGLCFVPRTVTTFEPGDLVEVVGFPELGGAFPLLHEALTREIGHSALPQAQDLGSGAWLAERNGTRVRIQATLVSLSKDRQEQVLGLQAEPHVFTARVPARSAVSFATGSRLELIGMLVARSPEADAGHENEAFEMLINSGEDIRLLARPAWSTLRQMIMVVAILLGGLLVALVWITMLRRQVEQRTAQLRLEIQERERTEQLRALEAERARIARDLHDDLGSSLTEITLLADAGSGQPPSLDRASTRFRSIGAKARALVKALDVIVWLVNPSRDALPFLAGYLGSFAEDFLSASGIGCRLRIPTDMPPLRLSASVRHNVFLAVKESLHNVVRHAHASEVLFEFAVRDRFLEVSVADNGQGFDPSAPVDGNGLANLKQRLESVGGTCEVRSQPGAGTTVRLHLPLPAGEQGRGSSSKAPPNQTIAPSPQGTIEASAVETAKAPVNLISCL